LLVLGLQGARLARAGDRGQAAEGLGVADPGRRGLDAVEVAVDGVRGVLAGAVWLPAAAGTCALM